jgi:hypothetical protein
MRDGEHDAVDPVDRRDPVHEHGSAGTLPASVRAAVDSTTVGENEDFVDARRRPGEQVS